MMNTTNKRRTRLQSLKFYLPDFIAAIGILIVSACINLFGKPYDRFFVERDPSLSYPYIPSAQNAVPGWLLAFLAFFIPIIVISLTQILRYRAPYFREFPKTPAIERLLLPYLVLIESVGVAYFVTVIIKAVVGRKRPNFFAFCNYQGYRDAIATNNFTSYDLLTKEGRPGSLSNCFETNLFMINESQYSFPSGHSSFVFAGLTVSFWFVLHAIPFSSDGTEKWHFRFWRVFSLIILLGIAATVACTRTRDYWHNFDDSLAGSVIGLACALFSAYINTHVRTNDKVTEENGLLLDDQAIVQEF